MRLFAEDSYLGSSGFEYLIYPVKSLLRKVRLWVEFNRLSSVFYEPEAVRGSALSIKPLPDF
jgi:hypothetical protein